MKTLIIYGTKYGTVKKCVDLIQKDLQGEVELCNLKEKKMTDIKLYDQVIIGGSIYMGRIQKEVTAFVNENLDTLLTKKVGLFICGIRTDGLAQYEIETNFPKALLDHASAKEYFGGEIIYKKMKFIDRLIVKMVSKADKDFPQLDENRNGSFIKKDSIKHMIDCMNGAEVK